MAGSISTGAGSCVAITPCGSATSCRGWRTVILLREPVGRALSMIAHRKRHRSFFERWGGLNVAAYLREDVFVRKQIENYQPRYSP